MDSGQGTTEYVGLLALVAAALLSAGAVVGLDDVGASVVKTVRTGICIVGGDICRRSDAEAAGLEPCTVSDRSQGGGATVSIAWVRAGDKHGWTVATRSDGSVVVTRTVGRSAGAGAGLGIEASPFGLELGVEGKADFTTMAGAAWEFPDAARPARFLAGKAAARPTWRFGEAGDVLTAEAGAKVGGRDADRCRGDDAGGRGRARRQGPDDAVHPLAARHRRDGVAPPPRLAARRPVDRRRDGRAHARAR